MRTSGKRRSTAGKHSLAQEEGVRNGQIGTRGTGLVAVIPDLAASAKRYISNSI